MAEGGFGSCLVPCKLIQRDFSAKVFINIGKGRNYYPLTALGATAFSLCSAVPSDGGWKLGADADSRYTLLGYGTDSGAWAKLGCQFPNGKSVTEHHSVSEKGVAITITGEGEIGYALPAFDFDGEKSSIIKAEEHTLFIRYDGWICRYTTDGKITDLEKIVANRNGHYRAFLAAGENEINVKIANRKRISKNAESSDSASRFVEKHLDKKQL